MSWAPDYITSDELSAYVRIPEGDTLDADQIAFAITAASEAINKATRRQFGLTDLEARYYVPEYDRASARWVVVTDDFPGAGEGFAVAVDSEADDTYAQAVETFSTWPLNAMQNGRPFERIKFALAVAPPANTFVRVTTTWGWAEVPAAIKQACLIQSFRFLKRREAWAGVVGSPEMGIGETRLLDTLDADVAVAVRPYRRVVMG